MRRLGQTGRTVPATTYYAGIILGIIGTEMTDILA